MTKSFKDYLVEVLNQYWCAKDNGQSTFDYYCFVETEKRFISISELAALNLVKGIAFNYQNAGIYSFSTNYTQEVTPIDARNEFWYGHVQGDNITFAGSAGTSIKLYFENPANRAQFISTVLNTPNRNWDFHYSKLINQLPGLIAANDHPTLLNTLLTLPDCGYKGLDAQVRVDLITKVLNDARTLSSFGVDGVEEVMILKLINEIDDVETTIVPFVDKLKTVDWRELFNSVDGDQSDILSDVLLQVADKYYKYRPAVNKGHFNYQKLGVTDVHSNYGIVGSGGQVSLVVNTTAPYQYIPTTVIIPPGDPFAVMTVSIDGTNFEIDQQLPAVPAILIMKMVHKEETQRAIDQAMIVVDVASLFFGVGEIRLALRSTNIVGKSFRLLLASGDFAATATDIYCNVDPNSQPCLKWKQYGPYIQMGLLSLSAIDQLKSLLLQSDEVLLYVDKFLGYSEISKIKNSRFIAKLESHGLDEARLTKLNGDLSANPILLNEFATNPELVDSWKVLDDAGVTGLSNKLDDIEFVGKHLDEIKGAGGYKAWRDVVIKADNVEAFSNLTSAQKLENIKNVWNTKYPIEDMLGGRSYFEDVMGQYRYTKSSGWLHTGDISFNFRGIDFYKGAENANSIFADVAVSMKTTVTKDVSSWLASAPMKKNIEFLKQGLDPATGIISNGKTMFITKGKIDIYMPKSNITDALKSEWMDVLNKVDPDISFEIRAIEDFVN